MALVTRTIRRSGPLGTAGAISLLLSSVGFLTTAQANVASPFASEPRPGGVTVQTQANVGPTGVGSDQWTTYGHDAQHSFAGETLITKRDVKKLAIAWRFPTGDAVTATPTVVDGTVYVGSWDGYFYALDLSSGALRWKFQLDAQPAVVPVPGQQPRPLTSDGGLVTSSAWFEPATTSHPALVIFGGGFTLYALDADSGALYWKYQYTGRPDQPPDPVNDGTRIFSSPVVADGLVFIGVSVDGAVGYRGYIVGADLRTGSPVWEFPTDVDASGHLLNDGCGSVWSSGSLLPALSAVVFDTADCQSDNQSILSESILALSIGDGHLIWSAKPQRVDPGCDYDFGATANVGLDGSGGATFLGVGGKDGTYYSLDAATGELKWATKVVFGGQAGGFIGTTAYDGHHVVGSTAIGDFGGPLCDPGNPRDKAVQEPNVYEFSSRTGRVLWRGKRGASFAPTTIAGGMAFNGVALAPDVIVRDITSRRILVRLRLPAPCWSGIATVGDALVLGTGTSYTGNGAGVVVFTPEGLSPSDAHTPTQRHAASVVPEAGRGM